MGEIKTAPIKVESIADREQFLQRRCAAGNKRTTRETLAPRAAIDVSAIKFSAAQSATRAPFAAR